MSNIGLATATLIIVITAAVIWGVNNDTALMEGDDWTPLQLAETNNHS